MFRGLYGRALGVLVLASVSGNAWALDPHRPFAQCARESWGAKDGLPEGPVYALHQTRDGFLWLGTTAALVRFDGQRFVSYEEGRRGLGHYSHARDLLELADGSLYAALVGGVTRGAHGSFTFYDEGSGLDHPFVYALAPGPDGSVWIGTGGTGVWQLRDGKINRHPAYVKTPTLPSQINDLAVGPDGVLWAATDQGVLALGDETRVYTTADGLPSGATRVLAFDRHGELWVGTRRGLAHRARDGGRFRVSTTHDGLPHDDVSALYPDREGSLWIGTYAGGLARLVDGEIEQATPASAAARGGVMSLTEDSEGALWVGTAQGLERYRDGPFVTAAADTGFGSEQVLNVVARSAGGVWVLDGAGAVFIYENGRPRQVAAPGTIAGEGMLGLYEAGDGSLWIGGRQLHHFEGGTWTTYDHPGGEFGVIVAGGALDGGGPADGAALLVVQTAGDGTSTLSRFEGGRFTTVPTPERLVHVQRITRDRADRLWISTGGGGLLRMQKGSSRWFRARDGLPHDVVYALAEDDAGNIWVATRRGLARIRNDRVDNLSEIAGLPRRSTVQLQLDGMGALWVNADDGIYRIPLAELTAAADGRAKTVAARHFTTADGLKSVELSWRCSGQTRTPDGRLWYATSRGLSVIDPRAALNRAVDPPTVSIEAVIAGDQPLDPAPEISIDAGRERIEVRYTAPSLTNPKELQFRYRLDGYDSDWVDASTRRVAYYTGLPAGTFRFRVGVRRGDGAWGTEPAELALRIHPRWNETPLARVLFGLAGAIVLMGLYRLRIGQMRLQKQALVKRVAERTAELRAEIAERRGAEAQIRRLNAELETRVRERTTELETANLALAADVAARQRTEAALADEKEKLSVTLRSIAEGVVTVDLEGRVVMLNPVAEGLTGWSSAEAAGKPVAEVLPVVDRWSRGPLRNDPVTAVLAGRETASQVITRALFTSRDGRQILIDASAAPIHHGRGQVMGAVLVFRDVTEKTRADEQIQKTQKLEAVGILAGGIAHDFNNFLTGIFGHVDLARRTLPADAPALRWLNDVLDELDGARGLARQLLTFSSGGTPATASHSLGELLDRSARFVLSGSGVSVELAVPADLDRCAVDGLQVRQVVDNLLINARQALPGGGHIKIAARNVAAGDPPGRYVEVSIADNGPGIPPAIADRIFEPFFTTKSTGSGLGLATVRSIVAQHGGEVTFTSHPGAGTTFRVLLRAAVESAAPAPPPARPRPAAPKSGHARILVMDDEPHIRNLLKVGLELEGYEVASACDGNEAVALHRQAFADGRPFDLAILDLTVGGGTGGLDTLPRLRDTDPALRVVASSGYARNDTSAELKAAGFDGILPKPYKLDDLAAIVTELLCLHPPEATAGRQPGPTPDSNGG